MKGFEKDSKRIQKGYSPLLAIIQITLIRGDRYSDGEIRAYAQPYAVNIIVY